MDSEKQPAEGKKRQATLFGFGVVTSKLQNEHQAKKNGRKKESREGSIQKRIAQTTLFGRVEERIHVGESKLVLRASGLNGRAGKTFVYLLPGQVVKKVTVLPCSHSYLCSP